MIEIDNILEVRVGEEVYGFNADEIEQILVIPAITPIPLSDSSVLGVAVLSGSIVHAIDLGIAIGNGDIDIKDDKARLLTLSKDGSNESFVVDEVLGMIEVDDKRMEENSDKDSFLRGFYKADERVVQLLNIDALLQNVTIDRFAPIKLDSLQDKKDGDNIGDESKGTDDFKRALFFRAENERFAIDIEGLRELIFAPKDITPIAGSDALGMITLRDEVITLLDMNSLLGFSYKEPDDKSRALIAYHKGKAVALLVDEVEEVKNLENSLLEPMPGGVAGEMIEQVYKEKDAVSSVISADFIRKLVREYHIESEEQKNDEQKDVSEADVSEVAVFKVGSEEYAFDIEEVQEIIRYDTITPVPEAPGFMEGILNLRGSVIPVISLPDRLGFGYEVTEKTKIIVCSVGEEKIGFIVDDVNEILFVEDQFVSKAVNEDALFEEVINLDDGKRVILKIRVENLLDEDILEQIKMASK